MNRMTWKTALAVSAVIALGLTFVILGVARSVTGEAKLPPQIEKIDPVRDAVRIPSQSDVFVDLQAGYTGVFVIDGLELVTTDVTNPGGSSAQPEPGQQITLPPTTLWEPGNATLRFTPTKGAAIESFTEGDHVVQVIYWKVLDGRGAARSFTWRFSVY